MKAIPVLIIPVLNRFDLLENALLSIDHCVENILVIDNSNSYKNSNVHVINVPNNIGVAASWNLGIKCYATSPYWVFMGNDVEWLPGTLEKISEISNEENFLISNYGFNAFSLGANIVKRVGLFDENYFPAYYEDEDFESRVRMAGLGNKILYPDIPVKIYGSCTTAKSGNYEKQKNKSNMSNKAYYQKKFASGSLKCYNFDLQRWIDNRWEDMKKPIEKEKKQKKKNKSFAAKGGTEILYDGLKKHTNINQYENINLLISTPSPDKLKYTKKNILWQHLSYSDESVSLIGDPAFMKAVSATVYVSHWQLEKFRYLFQVPLDNAHVIRNAIEPIEYKEKPKDEKIKLIYTSTPFRGLSILLDVMEILDRDDIELDVYSSTDIYSSGYTEAYGHLYTDLFDRAKSMKNVNYYEYVKNKKIHKALQEAHIFTYPSTFEETACLSMIEAAAAGCSLVTTDLGALPETGGMYAKMMTVKDNETDFKVSYAQHLNQAINDYWDKSNQELLKEQSDYFNRFYSWERRAKEWNEFFEKVSQ